jgi:proteasome lid subunit RPN8/RPN11
VIIPPDVRRALEEHAREEAPNEACGLVVLRDGEAVRYERGRNTLESPYRFELEVDPELWFLEDDGYQLAVFHSHPASAAEPSRTDVERIGLWEGRPFLILSMSTGDLAAFRISEGRVSREELG